MSYRKKSEIGQRWKTFRDLNRSLAGEAGLPDDHFESREIFVDFLLHGFTRQMSRDPAFLARDMTGRQHENFLALIRNYFAAGFPYFTPMALERVDELKEMDRLFKGI